MSALPRKRTSAVQQLNVRFGPIADMACLFDHLVRAGAYGRRHPIDVRNVGDIERAITDFARTANGGLIVIANPVALVHRKLIITLAAQHKLPTVYFLRAFVKEGGLISYGPDPVAPYGQAASYVDRIVKGEKPADLPAQAPTKYQLVINLKTAKASGLDVSVHLQQTADEVIE